MCISGYHLLSVVRKVLFFRFAHSRRVGQDGGHRGGGEYWIWPDIPEPSCWRKKRQSDLIIVLISTSWQLQLSFSHLLNFNNLVILTCFLNIQSSADTVQIKSKENGGNGDDEDDVKSVLKKKMDRLSIQIGYFGEYQLFAQFGQLDWIRHCFYLPQVLWWLHWL